MRDIIRKLLPQRVINYFWHLPKAFFANCIFGFPSWKLKVIGITGTDGKTTTTNMVYQILVMAGKKVSMVSTINAFVGGKTYDTGFHVTSPDPLMVQRFAREAEDSGDEYLVLEVTSHALDQFRFWGIKFLVGVITNITHEHLDYHKTFQSYKNTKLKLIENVKDAVINESLEDAIEFSKASKIITFGLGKGDFNQKKENLNLKIPGDYNIENALAAMAVASVLDIERNLAKKSLEGFKNLTGRMEKIPNRRGVNIYIDFAHTPNALENALKTLRKETRGKLISVFGCAGLRDVEKRPKMGNISTTLADTTIITAEDPRGLVKIINRQIITGISENKKENIDYYVIENRKKAIEFALKLAKRGDTIGIFGKGHENSMNLDGRSEISWSDRKAVLNALKHG